MDGPSYPRHKGKAESGGKRLRGRRVKHVERSLTGTATSLTSRVDLAGNPVVARMPVSAAPEVVEALRGKRSSPCERFHFETARTAEELPEPLLTIEIWSRDWRACRRAAKAIGCAAWIIQALDRSTSCAEQPELANEHAPQHERGAQSTLLCIGLSGSADQLQRMALASWTIRSVRMTDAKPSPVAAGSGEARQRRLRCPNHLPADARERAAAYAVRQAERQERIDQ
jgi:hypothetical protein